MNAPTAIVIEDEPQIRRFVRGALEAEGWQVHEAATLRDGLAAAGTRQPDLIVLDLGLPDGDGSTLIRDVRGWSAVPIIVLSARVDEADKIDALDAGADDYLTKPFGTGELLARVRANLRRPRAAAGGDEAAVFQFGEIEVDRAARLVRREGKEVHLTPTEYRLLLVLVNNAGRVLTQRQLLREVWGPSQSEPEPLPAHLHGPPAPEAGGRPGAAAPPADRDRRRLPTGGLGENRRRCPNAAAPVRLNKRMAELGLCSRREADDWIERGWVRVNGEPAPMGVQGHADDRIEVDPKARGQQAQQVTILLHKPMGYVSGQAEDGHEPAVMLINPRTHWKGDGSGSRFTPTQLRGLAPAGRLDIDSVGLLVLTQDGRVARQLIGEDSGMEKEYLVRVAYGPVTHQSAGGLSAGAAGAGCATA